MKDQKEINVVDKYKYENELIDQGIKYIAGCDEAGRGPLAGPVVVASCILPIYEKIEGIDDSKKLSAKKREKLYKEIISKALAYKIVFISAEEIDKSDIYRATEHGMIEAITGLDITPEYALIDAMPLRSLEIPHTSLIKGDYLSASIGAASILAKVARDEYMEKMDVKYPNYGFKHNKGYGTKMHMEALEKYGPSEIHRKSFAPISSFYTGEQLSLDLDIEE